MKKLLLFVLVLFSVSTYAQKGTAVKLPLAIGDTIRASGSVTKYLYFTGGYSGAAVQINAHKIGGTPGGTVKIYGSADQVNYNQIGIADTIRNSVDQAFIHYLTNPLPNKFKIVATGTGTDTTKISIWYRTPIYQNQ